MEQDTVAEKTIKIVHWLNENVITEGVADCLKTLLVKLVKENVYLRGADLTGAYLTGAYLTGADLTRAELTGAYLTKGETKINWQSHALIAEILWREADGDVKREILASFIGRKTDWCWDEWMKFKNPNKKWALSVLREWVIEDDGAPNILTK